MGLCVRVRTELAKTTLDVQILVSMGEQSISSTIKIVKQPSSFN